MSNNVVSQPQPSPDKFSTTRDRANTALSDLDPDDVLTESGYHFWVDGPDRHGEAHIGEQGRTDGIDGTDGGVQTPASPSPQADHVYTYPVVPSFQHLRLPEALPASWSAAPIGHATSNRVPDRDQSCRITCSSAPNEIAHVIPSAFEDWWRETGMYLHTSRPDDGLDADCSENAILLRRDLHYMWDAHRLVVPKQGRWVVHTLDQFVTDELPVCYHNLEMQPLKGVACRFFLARFALAILGRALIAKQVSTSRYLVTTIARMTREPNPRKRRQGSTQNGQQPQDPQDQQFDFDSGSNSSAKADDSSASRSPRLIDSSMRGDKRVRSWEMEQWGCDTTNDSDASPFSLWRDHDPDEPRGRLMKRSCSSSISDGNDAEINPLFSVPVRPLLDLEDDAPKMGPVGGLTRGQCEPGRE
ncbi:hypothetical protein AAE478_006361, partial [Parahypoxylon ruwenzoriense]